MMLTMHFFFLSQCRLQRSSTCCSVALGCCSPTRRTACSTRRATSRATATPPWCLCGAPSPSTSLWVFIENHVCIRFHGSTDPASIFSDIVARSDVVFAKPCRSSEKLTFGNLLLQKPDDDRLRFQMYLHVYHWQSLPVSWTDARSLSSSLKSTWVFTSMYITPFVLPTQRSRTTPSNSHPSVGAPARCTCCPTKITFRLTLGSVVLLKNQVTTSGCAENTQLHVNSQTPLWNNKSVYQRCCCEKLPMRGCLWPEQ